MKPLKCLLLVLIACVVRNAHVPPPTLEVASVKPNKGRPSGPVDIVLGCHGTDSHSPGMVIPLGRCLAKTEPLRLVNALAYDIPPASMYPYQGEILSGPSWMNYEVYEIEAKA